MTGFIAAHRGRFGVEPICRVMEFNPSTYWAARSRPPSQRALRDEVLKPEIRRVRKENYGVYGVHKLWKQLNREGIRVARCTARAPHARPGAARRAPRQEVPHDGA
jgi:putative transposase